MRKFLAVLLILIFIPIFLIVFLVLNFQAIILDKEIIKEALNKTGFYENIVSSVVSDYSSFGAKTSLVTKDEIEDLLNTTLPPETLKMEAEKIIDALYPYLLSKSDTIYVEYDIKNYKNTFITESEDLVVKKYDSLKKCTNKQLEETDLNNLEGLPDCKIPGYSGKDLLGGVAEGDFSSLLNEFPDKIVVTEKAIISQPDPNAFEGSSEIGFKQIRGYLDNRETIVFWGLIILTAILILISLLRWGSWKSISRWVGWALLLASINLAIASFAIFSFSFLTQGIVEPFGKTTALGVTIVSYLIEKMFYVKTLPQTIAIITVSLALIITPYFIKKKKEPEITS